jgi:hypothetical protein
MNVENYYRCPAIRRRISEFLEADQLDDISAVFITPCDVVHEIGTDFRLPHEINYFYERCFDINRSLWDHTSLIAHFDIEYVNYDFPAEPYLDPLRSFELQQGIVNRIQETLLEYGISPFHMLSGRGHHFVWRINRGSAAFGKLCKTAELPQHLKLRYATKCSPANLPVSPDLGAAYLGLGKVMEFVAASVKEKCDASTKIPIELSAVEVPPQERGREMVSIDITEYGDLLNTRLIRVPFSLYLKPWKYDGIVNDQIRDRIPVMVSVPFFEMNINEAVEVMRDLKKASELACKASVRIPDQSKQMVNLIDAYENSLIARLHSQFYEQEHTSPELWGISYDRFTTEIIPPCVRTILEYPNDLLLKPAGIRHVVRVLLSLGWHPRHIAGLIRTKYERNYGWGREWYFYDAATRSDFYTRIFFTQIASGIDKLTHFDCISVCSSGYCQVKNGTCSLEEFKKSLLERVHYERLADRPFNRLFLSNQYF